MKFTYDLIIEKVKECEHILALPNGSLHVSHGGALVMMELRHHTNDIDLNIRDEEKFERIKERCQTKHEIEPGRWVLPLGGGCDLHFDDCADGDLIEVGGIKITNRERTLDDYLYLNREKDQKWIEMLKTK